MYALNDVYGGKTGAKRTKGGRREKSWGTGKISYFSGKSVKNANQRPFILTKGMERYIICNEKVYFLNRLCHVTRLIFDGKIL